MSEKRKRQRIELDPDEFQKNPVIELKRLMPDSRIEQTALIDFTKKRMLYFS
ncbi:MAG: hypothetical protein AAB532_00445 [Patescibacteria group bacterium]